LSFVILSSFTYCHVCSLLGVFVKLWKITVSFVISVHLSAWNNPAPTRWIFLKFLYLSIFQKPLKKIQVSFKSKKNNWCFTWRPIYMFDHILLSSCWNDKCFFQKKVTEKIKTYIFVQYFFFNVPLWDNAEKYCRTGQARDDMAHAQCMLDS